MPDLFGPWPRRPADDSVIGRAAGLLPALEELIDADLQLKQSTGSEDRHLQLLQVERAWVRALDAGWAVEELTHLGLEPSTQLPP